MFILHSERSGNTYLNKKKELFRDLQIIIIEDKIIGNTYWKKSVNAKKMTVSVAEFPERSWMSGLVALSPAFS